MWGGPGGSSIIIITTQNRAARWHGAPPPSPPPPPQPHSPVTTTGDTDHTDRKQMAGGRLVVIIDHTSTLLSPSSQHPSLSQADEEEWNVAKQSGSEGTTPLQLLLGRQSWERGQVWETLSRTTSCI